jgi:hypothetical protein
MQFKKYNGNISSPFKPNFQLSIFITKSNLPRDLFHDLLQKILKPSVKCVTNGLH